MMPVAVTAMLVPRRFRRFISSFVTNWLPKSTARVFLKLKSASDARTWHGYCPLLLLKSRSGKQPVHGCVTMGHAR